MDSKLLEKRFSSVGNTADEIQEVSRWCLQNKVHQRAIVQSWCKAMRKAKVSQRLTLFYVCNDIVQNSRRKKFQDMIQYFGTAIKEVVPLVRDEKIKSKVKRIFNIWEERGIYDAKLVASFVDVIDNTGTVNAADNDTVLSTFQLPKLIDSLRNLKALEKTSECLLTDLKAQDHFMTEEHVEELRSTVKELPGSDNKLEEFEEAMLSLECYMASLQKEIEERTAAVALLEQAEIFYETQRGEAKLVATAYRNFSQQVKHLKNKLQEQIMQSPEPEPPKVEEQTQIVASQNTSAVDDQISSSGVANSFMDDSKMAALAQNFMQSQPNSAQTSTSSTSLTQAHTNLDYTQPPPNLGPQNQTGGNIKEQDSNFGSQYQAGKNQMPPSSIDPQYQTAENIQMKSSNSDPQYKTAENIQNQPPNFGLRYQTGENNKAQPSKFGLQYQTSEKVDKSQLETFEKPSKLRRSQDLERQDSRGYDRYTSPPSRRDSRESLKDRSRSRDESRKDRSRSRDESDFRESNYSRDREKEQCESILARLNERASSYKEPAKPMGAKELLDTFGMMNSKPKAAPPSVIPTSQISTNVPPPSLTLATPTKTVHSITTPTSIPPPVSIPLPPGIVPTNFSPSVPPPNYPPPLPKNLEPVTTWSEPPPLPPLPPQPPEHDWEFSEDDNRNWGELPGQEELEALSEVEKLALDSFKDPGIPIQLNFNEPPTLFPGMDPTYFASHGEPDLPAPFLEHDSAGQGRVVDMELGSDSSGDENFCKKPRHDDNYNSHSNSVDNVDSYSHFRKNTDADLAHFAENVRPLTPFRGSVGPETHFRENIDLPSQFSENVASKSHFREISGPQSHFSENVNFPSGYFRANDSQFREHRDLSSPFRENRNLGFQFEGNRDLLPQLKEDRDLRSEFKNSHSQLWENVERENANFCRTDNLNDNNYQNNNSWNKNDWSSPGNNNRSSKVKELKNDYFPENSENSSTISSALKSIRNISPQNYRKSSDPNSQNFGSKRESFDQQPKNFVPKQNIFEFKFDSEPVKNNKFINNFVSGMRNSNSNLKSEDVDDRLPVNFSTNFNANLETRNNFAEFDSKTSEFGNKFSEFDNQSTNFDKKFSESSNKFRSDSMKGGNKIRKLSVHDRLGDKRNQEAEFDSFSRSAFAGIQALRNVGNKPKNAEPKKVESMSKNNENSNSSANEETEIVESVEMSEKESSPILKTPAERPLEKSADSASEDDLRSPASTEKQSHESVENSKNKPEVIEKDASETQIFEQIKTSPDIVTPLMDFQGNPPFLENRESPSTHRGGFRDRHFDSLRGRNFDFSKGRDFNSPGGRNFDSPSSRGNFFRAGQGGSPRVFDPRPRNFNPRMERFGSPLGPRVQWPRINFSPHMRRVFRNMDQQGW